MIDAKLLNARLDFLAQLQQDRPIEPMFDSGYACAIDEVRHFVELTLAAPTLREIDDQERVAS